MASTHKRTAGRGMTKDPNHIRKKEISKEKRNKQKVPRQDFSRRAWA
jgi:hypothetical protein